MVKNLPAGGGDRRDAGLIPGLARSPGVGRASLVAQLVKNLPAMRETWVRSLGWEDPLEKRMACPLQHSCLENPMDRGAWLATVHGVEKSWT